MSLAPESLEEQDVVTVVALVAAICRVGTKNLLFARMNWDKLFSSANPPGAIAPSAARSTLTRQAKKDAAARQRARRAIVHDSRVRALQRLMSV